MMQQIQNKPLTPLEKLISDKERIRKQCVIQEQKLNDDFSYIQENAGSLLISGFTTLLFPNTKSKKNRIYRNSNNSQPAGNPDRLLGLSEYRTRPAAGSLGCSPPILADMGNQKGSKLVYKPSV